MGKADGFLVDDVTLVMMLAGSRGDFVLVEEVKHIIGKEIRRREGVGVRNLQSKDPTTGRGRSRDRFGHVRCA